MFEYKAVHVITEVVLNVKIPLTWPASVTNSIFSSLVDLTLTFGAGKLGAEKQNKSSYVPVLVPYSMYGSG